MMKKRHFYSNEKPQGAYSSHGKAHAKEAYGAHEGDMPPFSPTNKGAVGGLFPEDAEEVIESEKSAPSAEELPFDESPESLLELCKESVCPVCPVQKESDDTRLRALADLDNMRKRMQREKEEHIRFAAESVLQDIIPSLDNLELALQHANTNEACKDFVFGVAMTKKLLLEALAKHGLVQVGALGEEFDPAVHEAMGTESSEAYAPGHVSTLVSHGYKLHTRLLRPARVMVVKNA